MTEDEILVTVTGIWKDVRVIPPISPTSEVSERISPGHVRSAGESAPMTVMGTSEATRQIQRESILFLFLVCGRHATWLSGGSRALVPVAHAFRSMSASRWTITPSTTDRRRSSASRSGAGSLYSLRKLSSSQCLRTSRKSSGAQRCVAKLRTLDRSCQCRGAHKSEDPSVWRPGIFGV